VNFTERFAELAGQYCSWADLGVGDPESDYKTAIRLLPALYLAALGLQECDPGSVAIPSCSDAEWKSVYNRFRTMPVGLYPDVVDLSDYPAQTVGYGDLLDDLADIYRDLVGPLQVYNAGHSNAAVWNWRWGFQNHWGTHLVSALRILHHYRPDDPI